MAPKIAETCTATTCAHLLVRGTNIEFVSEEQARRVRCRPGSCSTHLDEKAMPSDIRLPKSFVLVHDTVGALLPRCEFFVVRAYRVRHFESQISDGELESARRYFGDRSRIGKLRVDVPRGPWRRVAKIRAIRYHRDGHEAGNFEHLYETPAWLYLTRRPLAWRLSLPSSCVVDDRGFVRP